MSFSALVLSVSLDLTHLMMIDNVMNNKDKRRTARYYERFSRYQTTKRERDFNNYWNKVVERMKEGKNK